MGIMLVYDITNSKSFDNISKWLRNIDEVLLFYIKFSDSILIKNLILVLHFVNIFFIYIY